MLIFGMLGLAFFTGLTLVTLNYSIYLLENKKIEDLASQIKKEKTEEYAFNKRKSSFASSNISYSNSKAIELFNKSERQLATIEDEEVGKFKFSFSAIISYIKKTIDFLIQLAVVEKKEINDSEYHRKMQDINQTVLEMTQDFEDQEKDFADDHSLKTENVSNIQTDFSKQPTDSKTEESNAKIKKTKPLQFNSFIVDKNQDFDTDTDLSKNLKPNNSENIKSKNIKQNKTQEDTGPALNYAAEKEYDDEKESQENKRGALFKKLETNILKKLKTAGLNHYDIWLELAKLYEKYGKTQEAVKIYAMILKHAQGQAKEFARNKLIALT
jgi:hypothetical protein